MSRITRVKIMGTDGNLSDPIPIGADAENIKLANKITVEQALGDVDTSKGSVSQQLDKIRADAVEKTPTKVSQLTNDANYITKEVSGLTNYYDKSNTYTKAEVNSLLTSTIDLQVVTSLPTTNIPEKTIFLIKKTDTGTDDIYDEFMFVSGKWELLGTTQIDLSVKQDKLISAQNIKTISGETLLGSGDINLPIIKVQSTQPATQSGRTIIWIDTSS